MGNTDRQRLKALELKRAGWKSEEIAIALYGEKEVVGHWYDDSPVQQKLKYCLRMARATMGSPRRPPGSSSRRRRASPWRPSW